MTDGGSGEAMLKELLQLRRGHGLLATDVMSRVGPKLAAACGLSSGMPTGIQRRHLVDRLSTAVSALPADLRLSVQAAFALSPADQSRFLRERMEWLADRLERDPRTAMRRVESGLELLAEELLTGPTEASASQDAYAPGGWYVDSFRATLMMHVDPVQLLETRRVTCTQERLEEVSVSWSIPAETPEALADLRVDILYGGELQKDLAVSTPTFWSGRLRLPRPLSLGEQHEFEVRVTALARSEFRPYYVLTPFRRCDEFILRAKFDRAAGPAQIWTLDGVPFQLLDENQPVGKVLEPDAVNEVSSHFRHLHQGLSYGLRWRFGAADDG